MATAGRGACRQAELQSALGNGMQKINMSPPPHPSAPSTEAAFTVTGCDLSGKSHLQEHEDSVRGREDGKQARGVCSRISLSSAAPTALHTS